MTGMRILKKGEKGTRHGERALMAIQDIYGNITGIYEVAWNALLQMWMIVPRKMDGMIQRLD